MSYRTSDTSATQQAAHSYQSPLQSTCLGQSSSFPLAKSHRVRKGGPERPQSTIQVIPSDPRILDLPNARSSRSKDRRRPSSGLFAAPGPSSKRRQQRVRHGNYTISFPSAPQPITANNGGSQFHIYLETNDTPPRDPLVNNKRPVSTGSIDMAHELLLYRGKRNKKLRHDQPSKSNHMRNDDGSRSRDATPPPAKELDDASKRPVPPFQKTRTTPSTALKCSKCGATETPQWRSGPRGTLCNFCGLLWEKRNNRHRRSLSL
ncbi:GATA zinc finger domain-containing protein [Sarocladium implicatum]|nr:GATA zinc finger domain-containing protein [Sarocladium implicatum]